MSQVKIRIALEKALDAITPKLPTAFDNVTFSPPAATSPFQQATVLFAEPDNPSFGDSFHREKGIFQITLLYPLKKGTADATARAELLRSIFKRGTTLVEAGVYVTIERTPEISSGKPDGDRWAVPVKIRFFSNINP